MIGMKTTITFPRLQSVFELKRDVSCPKLANRTMYGYSTREQFWYNLHIIKCISPFIHLLVLLLHHHPP